MSTQAEIEVSYGLASDFFRLWLDAGMSYSGALFGDPDDTLEVAQRNKLAWLCDAARVEPGMRVLDLGCGWGAGLDFLVRHRRVADAVGLTLSPTQHDEVRRRRLPGVGVELADAATWTPAASFDAVISIEMLQHVATPADVRRGEHVELYRAFFRRIHAWTVPGAWCGVQVITSLRVPRDRAFLRDVDWASSTLFPGASTPRLESVVAAATPYWELTDVQVRRDDYRRTIVEWLRRLRGHEADIRARWGDDTFARYDRYLAGCVTAFADGYFSLARLALRRVADAGRGHANGRR